MMSIYSITAISKSRYNNLFQNHAVAYSGHPIVAKYALGRCFSFSSCAATRVRAPCPTTPGYAPQVWAFSAKAGHAKEENRQRLEGRLPPTAGSLIFRPTRRVGHDFLELQCGKTNAGQILLRALEEKAPFSPPPGRVPLQPPLRHRHCCHHLPLRQWLALRLALPALRHRHCCLGGSRHLPLRQWLALSRQRLALQPQHRRQRLAGLPPHR